MNSRSAPRKVLEPNTRRGAPEPRVSEISTRPRTNAARQAFGPKATGLGLLLVLLLVPGSVRAASGRLAAAKILRT